MRKLSSSKPKVMIPPLESVRAFAQTLHVRGVAWSGAFAGWPASYTPEECTQRPASSRMTFVPAEFSVGDSEIWHVSIAWEDGRDAPPVELENRRGVQGESWLGYWDEVLAGAKMQVQLPFA